MAEVRHQIFVSSTYEDLKEERNSVVKVILELGNIPVGMEMFSAEDEAQWNVITRNIDQSDYYVVIAANRYGQVTSGGLSYTEKEYDYAMETEIPVLAFIIDENAPWPGGKNETGARKIEAVKRFKDKLKENRLVDFWTSKEDLPSKVGIALMKQIVQLPRPGWVRNIGMAGSEVTGELTRLSAENAELREKLEKAENREGKDAETIRTETIDILARNEIVVKYWYQGIKSWSEAESDTATLFELFVWLGPELQVEKSTSEALIYFAKMTRSDDFKKLQKTYPIPVNTFKMWLADLSALDLIMPSTIPHGVKDKNEYWTLSEEGREVLKMIRRANLKIGEREELPKVIDE